MNGSWKISCLAVNGQSFLVIILSWLLTDGSWHNVFPVNDPVETSLAAESRGCPAGLFSLAFTDSKGKGFVDLS